MLFRKDDNVWFTIVRLVIYDILLLVKMWKEEVVKFRVNNTSFGRVLLLNICKGELVMNTVRLEKVLF